MLKNIGEYIQAGFDESLVKLVKGVFASALIAATLYLYHHLSGYGLSIMAVGSSLGLGTPALLALWHWLKTTAGLEQEATEVAQG